MGIQCALCHSTVDDSFAQGIGRRRDGWANRDLNVGAIIALAPRLESVATLLGADVADRAQPCSIPGVRADSTPSLFVDGKAFRPDGKSASVLIPPAFGLAGVNLHTWTGWGGVSHWNAFVANLEMHGKGTFFDPRLDDADAVPDRRARRFRPRARGRRPDHADCCPRCRSTSSRCRRPRRRAAASIAPRRKRGEDVFNGKADCGSCHVPPLFTEPGWNMHTGAEIGIDDFQASRSPDARYRTAPLRGLWTHTTGGFYHDGRFPTLAAVIDHYDSHFSLGLIGAGKERPRAIPEVALKLRSDPISCKRGLTLPILAGSAGRVW